MSWATARQRVREAGFSSEKKRSIQFGPFEQHEERHEGDRHRREHNRHHALRDGEGRPRDAEQLRCPALTQRLSRLVDEVVLALEEPEPAAALRQVVEVVGDLVREVVHLVDQSGNEQPADQCDGDECADEDDPGREAAPLEPVL